MSKELATPGDPNENTEASATQDPPDGGYGWVCVAACFTINCFTWGVVAVSLVLPFYHPSIDDITPFSPMASTLHTTSLRTSFLMPHLSILPSSAVSISPWQCSLHLSSPSLPENTALGSPCLWE